MCSQPQRPPERSSAARYNVIMRTTTSKEIRTSRPTNQEQSGGMSQPHVETKWFSESALHSFSMCSQPQRPPERSSAARYNVIMQTATSKEIRRSKPTNQEQSGGMSQPHVETKWFSDTALHSFSMCSQPQ